MAIAAEHGFIVAFPVAVVVTLLTSTQFDRVNADPAAQEAPAGTG